MKLCCIHAVVVRKFSAALVVLRRTALVDLKQTDDADLGPSELELNQKWTGSEPEVGQKWNVRDLQAQGAAPWFFLR